MPERKIAFFTGNRAEYGLLSPIVSCLVADRSLEISAVISGSHLTDDYGATFNEINLAGIKEVRKIQLEQEITDEQVKTLFNFADLVKEGTKALKELKPGIFIVAGDRAETFALTIAAFYLNIPIAHIFGGDISQGGHLDDSTRHSISKLAHLHFVTNEDSYNRIVGLGEEKWRVFNVGSPIVDNVMHGGLASQKEVLSELNLNRSEPVVLFTQHPVTTESEAAYKQVKESLEALRELGYQAVITYPCDDAGSQDIIKAINEYSDNPRFRIRKSLGWKLYLGCMKISACVVGNSSSGLMETPVLKVPCVNIGTRQAGRLRSENVIDVPYDKEKIKEAIKRAIFDEEFSKKVKRCRNPYGDGHASERIIEVLKNMPLGKKLLQKKMTY